MAWTVMPKIERRDQDGQPRWVLQGRELRNGDRLELRLHGNRGWEEVTVEGLPGLPKIRFDAWDGKGIVTSLPLTTEVKWPRSPDQPELRRQGVQRGRQDG